MCVCEGAGGLGSIQEAKGGPHGERREACCQERLL